MNSVYSREEYDLPEGFLRQATQLKPLRSFLAIGIAWVSLLGAVLFSRWLCGKFWAAYPLCLFLIAGRQGVLLQILHECSHRLISHSRAVNLGVARWICAYPIGLCADGYIRAHLTHHGNANTEKDPLSDREKYRETDFTHLPVYLLLVKDLVGITALKIFFLYREYSEEKTEQRTSSLLWIALVQCLLIATVFRFDFRFYILFWIVPAMTAHMFLMRIRGIAEHGLAHQLGKLVLRPREGERLTRSFLTPLCQYRFPPFRWIEKLLIGTLSVHFHHEHHLMPNVPFYHLAYVHSVLGKQIQAKNPDVYASGYFSAAMKNLLDRLKAPAKTVAKDWVPA